MVSRLWMGRTWLLFSSLGSTAHNLRLQDHCHHRRNETRFDCRTRLAGAVKTEAGELSRIGNRSLSFRLALHDLVFFIQMNLLCYGLLVIAHRCKKCVSFWSMANDEVDLNSGIIILLCSYLRRSPASSSAWRAACPRFPIGVVQNVKVDRLAL